MGFLNVVAWIILTFTIFVYTLNVLVEEHKGKRSLDFIFLLGYVATLIAYIKK